MSPLQTLRAGRAGILAAVACVAALGLGSCLAPKPKPDDWLAFGYRSPEATVQSFLTALAGDRNDLEYLCLSRDLKDREGGNLLGYLEFRDELRRQMPWLRAAARAEVTELERRGPDSRDPRYRARVQARVDWLFWDETFFVDLVAEGYYEYWSDADRLEDGYLEFAPTQLEGAIVAALPPLEEGELDDVTELRAGLEWKIDSLSLPDPEP